MRQLGLAVVFCIMAVLPAIAQESSMEEPTSDMETVIDTVRVTGTWAPLAQDRRPENMTVIEGAELRRRGAADLRTAMALVTGVEAVPGGDAGPAGAVPAFWGLREFDAFLLVVDGVPWGGAFIPNLPTLDLNDVDRIEVLRGPAPITYGATSFVGVIHVLHKNPGSGLRHVEVGGGSYGSFHGSAATDIGTKSRLSVDGSTNRYADESTSFDRVHGRYRLSLAHGIQVDADAHVVNQDPASPSPRKGTSLDPAIPIDSNHNPDDAKLNTTRLQLSATQASRIVSWTAAFSHVEDDFIRGFLQPDATDDGSTPNANGFTQERDLTEFYGLAHHRFTPMEKIGLTVGGDALFGKGKEESENFTYYAALDGTRRESSSQGVPDEDTEFEAERTFLGAFAEADWHPTRAWT